MLEARKKAVRNTAREILNGMGEEYIAGASKNIRKEILKSNEYKEAGLIFIFVGTSKEIETIPLIEKALEEGKRVAVPKCIRKGEMIAKEIKSVNDLVIGKYNILEPNDSCLVVDKKEIDLGIIPCLAADICGNRLGHGGGYYDRYLKDADFECILVCFDKTILEKIPVDTHDIRFKKIITDKK